MLEHNADYTVITITSDNLDSYDSLKLTSGTSSYTPTETAGVITVNLTSLFSTTNLTDGVYDFVLTITSGQTETKEYYCLFVDKETKCKVAECVKDTQKIELQLDYYILSRASTCSCKCDDMETIYNRLINGLNNCSC